MVHGAAIFQAPGIAIVVKPLHHEESPLQRARARERLVRTLVGVSGHLVAQGGGVVVGNISHAEALVVEVAGLARLEADLGYKVRVA